MSRLQEAQQNVVREIWAGPLFLLYTVHPEQLPDSDAPASVA